MRHLKSAIVLLVSFVFLLSGCSGKVTNTSDDKNESEQLTGTVIYNVRGYTFKNDEVVNFNYLHFADGGKIIATGSGDPPNAGSMRDANNAVMLPGLIDAHGHVSSLGRAMSQVDLMGITTLEETLEVIKAYADANPDLEIIRGRGWNQELWTKAVFPTALDLDNLGVSQPIVLGRVDGHAVWLNSKALTLAGINDKTEDPAGGEIIRDSKGKASGVLVDTAEELIVSQIPEPDQETINKYLNTAMQHLVSLGMTATHDAGVNIAETQAYQNLQRNKKMPMRVYAMLSGIETQRNYGKTYTSPDEKFIVRSVKMYVDGALGSRGAALLEDYTDRPGQRGLVITEQDVLTAAIREARQHYYQVNVHAIGDRGNRMVLDAFKDAEALETERHRIEHSQIVHPDDIPRFKTQGIIPSMQGVHATSDMHMAEKRLGKDRLAGAYAWRTFLDQGSRIANGSDFPVELPNLFHGLYASVTRQDKNSKPDGGWLPEQRMTRAETLKSFTIDAAYAAHMDKSTGSLEPGKWADFVLMDKDFFKVPDNQIHALKVNETWVGGQQVYKR